MRRLEIDFGRYDLAVVSPVDRDCFVETLRARNPAIEST